MIVQNGVNTSCLVIFSYICKSQTFYNLIFINHDHNYNCFNCNYSHVYMG